MIAVAALLGLFLTGGHLQAWDRETATVESATEVLAALSAIPERGIPPAVLGLPSLPALWRSTNA